MKTKQVRFSHSSLEIDEENRLQGNVARLIDSTLLKQNFVPQEIENLCFDAVSFGFRAVCVPPSTVSFVKGYLNRNSQIDAPVLVCSVVGFPLGYNTTKAKCFELVDLIGKGANEIDFVQNVLWVKAKDWENLKAESTAAVEAAGGNLVKVILETSLLTAEEISQCTDIHARCGVHVIKTSTGFGSRGANSSDLETIAATLKKVTEETGVFHGIKASGGIQSLSDAQAFLKLGATRLGTSSGVKITKGENAKGGY
jgi:deoxyribose-phosphate aldolase